MKKRQLLETLVMAGGIVAALPGTGGVIARQDDAPPPAEGERIEQRIVTIVYDVRDLMDVGVGDASAAPNLALYFPLDLLPREARRDWRRNAREEMLPHIIDIIDDIFEFHGAGEVSTIESVSGNLVIKSTVDVHRDIQGMLSQLREIRRQAADVEVTFFEADEALVKGLELVLLPTLTSGRPSSGRAWLAESQVEALQDAMKENQIEAIASPRVLVGVLRPAMVAVSEDEAYELPLVRDPERRIPIKPLDGVAVWIQAQLFGGLEEDPDEQVIELKFVARRAEIEPTVAGLIEREAAEGATVRFKHGEAVLLRLQYVRNTLDAVDTVPDDSGEMRVRDIVRTRIETDADDDAASEAPLYILIRARKAVQEEDPSMLFQEEKGDGE